MRQTRLYSLTVVLISLAAVSWLETPAQAQNDWQYPDPYFGILEIEKSHNGSTARRYRAEVNPAPRASRSATPSATPAPVTPAPVTQNRWRNRWRRQ